MTNQNNNIRNEMIVGYGHYTSVNGNVIFCPSAVSYEALQEENYFLTNLLMNQMYGNTYQLHQNIMLFKNNPVSETVIKSCKLHHNKETIIDSSIILKPIVTQMPINTNTVAPTSTAGSSKNRNENKIVVKTVISDDK